MRERMIYFALIIMLSGYTSVTLAQNGAEKQCFTIKGSTEHSFGEIEQTSTVEHTFVFRNNCKDTVEIGSARASCGCTAAVISEKVIPPGGEAQIHVKFTPTRGSRGTVTKTVSVFLKDATEPNTILRISANLRSDIDIQPSYIQLTDATVGKKISARSTIKNTSEKDLTVLTNGVSMTSYPDTAGTGRVTSVPLSGGSVTPTSLNLKPGESGELTIELTPEFVGQINGSVGLKVGENSSVIYVFGVIKGTNDKIK